MGKYIPVDPEKWAAMVIAQSDLVRYKEICDELDAECTRLKAEVEELTGLLKASTYYNTSEEVTRLKAEVERLTAFTTRTIIPNEELQAQVERLTKENETRQRDMNLLFQEIKKGREAYQRLHYLYLTAKEGKQP